MGIREDADAWRSCGGPVVRVGSPLMDPWDVPWVRFDHAAAGRLAARSPVDGGAERFAYLGCHTAASAWREEGFAAALAQVGHAPRGILSALGTRDSAIGTHSKYVYPSSPFS